MRGRLGRELFRSSRIMGLDPQPIDRDPLVFEALERLKSAFRFGVRRKVSTNVVWKHPVSRQRAENTRKGQTHTYNR